MSKTLTQLEYELYNTKPGSKEEAEILKQIEQLRAKIEVGLDNKQKEDVRLGR